MQNPNFINWLAKMAAQEHIRQTTSRSGTVKVDSQEGRNQAQATMTEEPPTNAQGHSPTRYGRKVKR